MLATRAPPPRVPRLPPTRGSMKERAVPGSCTYSFSGQHKASLRVAWQRDWCSLLGQSKLGLGNGRVGHRRVFSETSSELFWPLGDSALHPLCLRTMGWVWAHVWDDFWGDQRKPIGVVLMPSLKLGERDLPHWGSFTSELWSSYLPQLVRGGGICHQTHTKCV